MVALILAGGKSQRFGSPKVLAHFNGIPFLRLMRQNLQQAGMENIVLVLGHRAEQIMPILPDREAFKVVVNADYEQGQFSSLRRGIQALGKTNEAVLMCLIDQPHITSATYRTLLEAHRKNPQAIIIPTFRERGGHPVVLPAALFPSILAAPQTATLRDILREHSEMVLRLRVDEAGILDDIDTPEDLKRLEEQYLFNRDG
jgi:CTP:molybdopterin cytidylyltransferase MocA